MKYLFLSLLLSVSFFPIESSYAQRPSLELLSTWLEGNYSTADSITEDSVGLGIDMHIKKLYSSADSVWFYIEKSINAHPKKPFEQQILKVWNFQNSISSRSYSIASPFSAVGAWRSRIARQRISLDSLSVATTCEIPFVWRMGGYYEASTSNLYCSSDINGADYLKSDIKIFEDRMEIWDRGFTLAGDQVWGPENGPYIFLKQLPEND